MASWEDTKRAAQSAYDTIGKLYQDAYGGIGAAYQQILIGGQLYPQADRSALNYEIAQDAYDPTAQDWKEYERYRDEWERDNPDPGMDPER